jgi:hypothetical protein
MASLCSYGLVFFFTFPLSFLFFFFWVLFCFYKILYLSHPPINTYLQDGVLLCTKSSSTYMLTAVISPGLLGWLGFPPISATWVETQWYLLWISSVCFCTGFMSPLNSCRIWFRHDVLGS